MDKDGENKSKQTSSKCSREHLQRTSRSMSFHGGSSGRRPTASPSTGKNSVEAGNSSKGKERARLMLNPEKNHKPEKYDDLELDISPWIFSSLERYLPRHLLRAPRDLKVNYMREILHDYAPPSLRYRDQKQREYREKIMSNYLPLHKELYTIDPVAFFVPTFLKAINDNTEQSFRRIMSEPAPGIFTFEMLQPRFCELLISEFENFEKWVNRRTFCVMRPNTMNQYGAVLDDFGLQTMLNKLMEYFICPLSKVFYAEIGGSTLDSHHGFIVECGLHRDVETEFHVDDSEVTLNVCLGRQFTGGELYFRGMRCDKHVHTISRSEEYFDYSHVPGCAVLHHGRHRHGARATISGHRINLLMWCRRCFLILLVFVPAYIMFFHFQENFAGVLFLEKCKSIKEISLAGVLIAITRRKISCVQHMILPEWYC
ncbi:2-oxoglutarate and iron-dependent oxygenase domain-containing protein CP2-like isoform X2 [Cicer arietinum]|uniref:2-oxoglutarate and iron-dependent oxygenase domain-containing protein CP2-like isoform X2 n=1 Tax=Cicer arietinum TaxID=3827 RepID=UPI003CC511BB